MQRLVWFRRYIDDILLYMDASWRGKLNICFEKSKWILSLYKFFNESSKESIAFLEMKISWRNGKVCNTVYVTPTDGHQYLHYLSAHPYHSKKSVVFGQTLWISSLWCAEKDFENHKEEIKSWFRKREYPEDLISSQMNKVKASVRYFYQTFIFLPNDNPSKTEKCFLLYWKNSFRSQDIGIFVFPSSPLFLSVGHCFRGWLKIILKFMMSSFV